jgi:hypothetical protein
MSTRAQELALELLALPAADRALLATHLILGLDDSSAPDAESLWVEEARRRSAEIDAGTVTCRRAEEVFRDARKSLEGPR